MIDRRTAHRLYQLVDSLDGTTQQQLDEAVHLLLRAEDFGWTRAAAAMGDMDAERLADRLQAEVWRDGRLQADQAEVALLRKLPPQRAARLLEAALQQWPAAARASRRDSATGQNMHQALLDLVAALPPNLPLRIGVVLRRQELQDSLPAEWLSWILSRGGPQRMSDWALRGLRAEPGHRRDRVQWLHGMARSLWQPPPRHLGPPWPQAAPSTGGTAAAEAPYSEPQVGGEPEDPFYGDIGFIGLGGGPPRPTRAAPPNEPPALPPTAGAEPPAAGAEPPQAPPGHAAEQGHDDEFHFLLEGEAARGHTLRAHSRASLHFRYGLAPLDALATVHHAALEDAVVRSLDITLQLTACGAVRLEGERRALASMRNGQLQQPVRFQLLAGDAPAVPDIDDEHGVHVEFIIQGATVHQMLLRIDVLSAAAWDAAAPADGAAPAPPQATGAGPALLARAAALAPPPSDQLRLSVSVDAGSLHLDLQHLKDGEAWFADSATSALFDLTSVAALAKQLRATLSGSYKVQAAAWQRFDGQVDAADVALQQALRHAMECAATAGSALNKALREDQDLARLLEYVETGVPDGARLTISTDRVFLPWELLTPQTWALHLTDSQRAKLPPLDPGRFWGVRFAVETVPRRVPVGQRMVDHLKATPRRVNVNLHPDIEVPGVPASLQPLAVHTAWAQRMQAAGRLDGPVNQACLPMREVLQSAHHHASLIYLYCHGQSDDPFGGGDERLVLDDDDCALAPGDLEGEVDYGNAPIVFLNACESGAPSPLAFSQFLKGFCERGAIGLIATTHSVPIQFASRFGPEVVDGYLGWQGSLAQMMSTLRRRHIAQGNPVPLFYTLQCQLALPIPAATGNSP